LHACTLSPFSCAAGAAGKPVTIIRRGGGGSGGLPSSRGGSFGGGLNAAGAAGDADDAALLEDPAVAELAAWGYPPGEAAAALVAAAGDVHRALAALHARLAAAAGAAAAPAATAAGGEGDGLAQWGEEREALEAIFGVDISFPTASAAALRLPVELTSAAASAAAGGRHSLALELDFFLPGHAQGKQEGGREVEGSAAATQTSYPHAPPLVGVRCTGVPAAALLTLTRRLALQAAELAGQAMVFELASAAAEGLEECLLAPLPLSALLPPPGDGGGAEPADGGAELAQHAERELRLEDIHNSILPPASSRQRQHRPRQQQPAAAAAAESARLAARQAELESAAEHAAMRAVRAALPAAAKRRELLELCAARRVVVVSGATGCGKSTQASEGLCACGGTGAWGLGGW
jgi:hypothetical protein